MNAINDTRRHEFATDITFSLVFSGTKRRAGRLFYIVWLRLVMVKAKAENMGFGKRWSWAVVGALIAIFVAVAVFEDLSNFLTLWTN